MSSAIRRKVVVKKLLLIGTILTLTLLLFFVYNYLTTPFPLPTTRCAADDIDNCIIGTGFGVVEDCERKRLNSITKSGFETCTPCKFVPQYSFRLDATGNQIWTSGYNYRCWCKNNEEIDIAAGQICSVRG